MEDKQGGIGPFTKEQNYETKDSGYSVEILPTDVTSQRRGLGPFTKEQNRRVVEVETATTFEDAEKRRDVANPWSVLDLSGDGDSNSLENAESEHGRSFSGAANLIYRASTVPERVSEITVTTVATTTENLPEIREPVLRPNKKDAGRSLKLPEITEPILRPRATRQNTRNEVVPQQHHERQSDEIQETSSTSTRAFTVQFLPERLASILAQAERYARQTLLPLISQYTPSFVTGIRHEEPKYFPLLSDIMRSRSIDNSAETSRMTGRQRNSDQILRVDIGKSEKSFSLEDERYEEFTSSAQTENGKNEHIVQRAEVSPVIVEAVYPEKIVINSTGLVTKTSENSDWHPIGELTTPLKNSPSRRDSNVSRSLDWSVDSDWTSRTANANAEAEVKLHDDWIPITIKSDTVSTTAKTATSSEETAVMAIDTVDNLRKSAEDSVLDETKEEATTVADTYERKFIPLVDLEATTDGPSSSTDANDVADSTTVASHIQKIPRYKTTVKSARVVNPTMMFPYAYERKNDPRTRYIPLIPEEDMGKAYPTFERDR